MNDHHLVLGTLTDFLTQKTLDDTLDERYRQDISRRLVMEKDYLKSEIIKDYKLTVAASNKKAIIKIDFIVCLNHEYSMLIKYGPGSITTRHRSALAASRLVGPYQIPCVVVTNGEDADILDGQTGQVDGYGLDRIPTRQELIARATRVSREPICSKRSVLESRILFAFDVDGSCPCDTDICRIDS